MKINNVEKFRKEIYDAINDSIIWNFDKIETPSAIWKGTNDDYEESMLKCSSFKFVDGELLRVSLVSPMIIENEGKKLYMTIDEDGATFWKSTDKEFKYRGHQEAGFYRNKMSFAMKLVHNINYMLGC